MKMEIKVNATVLILNNNRKSLGLLCEDVERVAKQTSRRLFVMMAAGDEDEMRNVAPSRLAIAIYGNVGNASGLIIEEIQKNQRLDFECGYSHDMSQIEKENEFTLRRQWF
jgi:hypothetical protein